MAQSLDKTISEYLEKNNLQYLSCVGIIGNQSVGKSSVLNLILGENTAKVSNKQCTTEITYYRTADGLHLADIPGLDGSQIDQITYYEKNRQIISKMAGMIFVTTANDITKGFVSLVERISTYLTGEILIIVNRLDEQVKNVGNGISDSKFLCPDFFPQIFSQAKLNRINTELNIIVSDLTERLSSIKIPINYVFVQANVYEILEEIAAYQTDLDNEQSEDLFPYNTYVKMSEIREMKSHRYKYHQMSGIQYYNSQIKIDLLEMSNQSRLRQMMYSVFENAKLYMLSNILNEIYYNQNIPPIGFVKNQIYKNIRTKQEYQYEEVITSCWFTYKQIKTGIRTIINDQLKEKYDQFSKLTSDLKNVKFVNGSFYQLPSVMINTSMTDIIQIYLRKDYSYDVSEYLQETEKSEKSVYQQNAAKKISDNFFENTIFLKLDQIILMINGNITYNSKTGKFHITKIDLVCKINPIQDYNYNECKICTNNITNDDKYLYTSCHHGVFCINCQSEMNRCPICNNHHPDGFVKIYI